MYALTGVQSAGSSGAVHRHALTAERQVIAHLGGDRQIVDQQPAPSRPALRALSCPTPASGRPIKPAHGRLHRLAPTTALPSAACGFGASFHPPDQEVFAGQGVTAEQFTMIGGGSQNELLLQICSDVFQKPLLHGMLKTGATSFGAAIAGAVGVGVLGSFSEARAWLSEAQIVHPDPRMAEVYLPLYEQFQVAYRLLEPLFQGKQS